MSNYAKADTRTQWFANAYPGARINPNCGVLHTTEGTGWPDYGGGKSAPNYTARPDFTNKRLVWRAHFPDEMSARALVNAAGGVDTNTANTVQVELVGTCDPKHAKSWNGQGRYLAGRHYIYWPAAPDWAKRDVGAFLKDMHARHRIALTGPAKWLPYPKSYGSSGGQRMSHAQWRAFYGWCGHQHVPENDHGDPGALDFAGILALAKGTQSASPAPPALTKEWFDMPIPDAELDRIALRVWQYTNPNVTKRDAYAHLIAAGDPKALAAAVKAVLPAQGPVSQDQLEAALRKVLGSVDDK